MRETRQKIKGIAKTVMFGNSPGKFLRLIFLLVLNFLTSALLVRVFGLLGEQLRPESSFEIFGLSVNPFGLGASVLSAFFAVPLELGVTEHIMKLVRRQECRLGDVFGWYGSFSGLLRAFPFGVFSVFSAVFQIVLFDMPLSYIQSQLFVVLEDVQAQIANGADQVFADYGLMNAKGVLLALVLMLVAAVLSVLFVGVVYIYLDTGRIFSSVFRSPAVMLRFTWNYMLFVLSFAGFYIATVFTLGLMGAYLLPYFGVSKAVFVEYARTGSFPSAEAETEE